METTPSLTVPPQQRKAKRLHRFLYSQSSAAYVFVLPFIVSFALFFAYPVYITIYNSFHEVLPGITTFVGLDNYKNLANSHFYRAIYNNTIYTCWTLLMLIPFPLLFAVFLNSKKLVFRNVFKSALFIPALTSVVVAGTIFRLIFGELEGSLMNHLIGMVGFEPRRWLMNGQTGMFALVLLACWRWTGVNILYFLSGLQAIPNELYESAEIDGATSWKKLIHITMPLLKPVTIYVLTISIYGGYAMFTESYMLWNGNGSPNDIGLTMVGYIYKQGFEQFNFGFGSAIGLTLLAFTLLLNVIQLKFFGMFRKED